MPSFAEIAPPLFLTAALALVATLLLLLIGTPIAWWLARTESRWREPIAALVALPLVLPPTVIGFYLLIAFGPYGPGGGLASLWGARTPEELDQIIYFNDHPPVIDDKFRQDADKVREFFN